MQQVIDLVTLKGLKGKRTALACIAYVVVSLLADNLILTPDQVESVKTFLYPFGLYAAIDHGK